MLLKKPNTLNYPIVFWNIAKFFQIVFRYLKHLDRLLVSSTGAWMGKLGPLNFAGAVLDVLVVVWW